MSVKVLITDDHPIIRERIISSITAVSNGIEVVGEASNEKEVLEFPKKDLVDVYILDIVMPKLNGIETSIKLPKLNPMNKIIILMIHDNKSLVKKALDSGVKGYLLKEEAIQNLNQAIQRFHVGNFFFRTAITEIVVKGVLSYLSSILIKDGASPLSDKEGKIFRSLVEGNSDEATANNMNLLLSKVKTLKTDIKSKLKGFTQPDLIRLVIEKNILK